ncbi:MAG: glutathione peroxidase [Asticcacaulis sp.]
MTNIYDIPLKRIDGEATMLKAFAGKVLLAVNVASKCGLTAQYEGLEALYRQKSADGLEILGFPANNFLGQEPGSDAEIADFCSTNFDVTFPMFAKVSVAGPDKHPLYEALTTARPEAVSTGPMRERLMKLGIPVNPEGEVLWNFEKFLISRTGDVVERFAPDVTAEDPRLLAAIDRELAK